MAFTAAEVTELGYSSLNYFLKNNPIDQVAQERPLLRKLMAGKRSFPGGNDSVVEQLRKSYDGNMQWFQGDATVTYNTRNTLDQAKYPWKGAHDGFQFSEDYLLANAITVVDNGQPAVNSSGERARLTNLFKESMEVLRLGFEESLDQSLHIAAAGADNLEGLDTLVAIDPTTGTVGGVNRATNTWWRNQYATSVAQASLIQTMEQKWRLCTVNGGSPDCIIAGAAFVDDFRAAAKSEVSRYMVQQTTFTTPGEIDPSIKQASGATYTGLHFQGVPIMYDPTFEVLDALYSPASAWTDRCYMLNTKHLRLRPAKGHDMIPRRPPRSYDKYVHRWGLTWKGALTMNRANCHAVLVLD